MKVKRIRFLKEDWVFWHLDQTRNLHKLMRGLGIDPKKGYSVGKDQHGDYAVHQVQDELPSDPINYEDLIPKEKPK